MMNILNKELEMKTFKDLEFKEHPMVEGARKAVEKGIDMEEYLNAKQAKIEFDNGVKLSVIFGSVFYSNGIDTYEAMALSESNEDPRGYLSKEQVSEYMIELQEQEKLVNI